jgi:hypothetical protein
MAITNLSNQHISASFQYLAQISSSGNIYDGFGNQITQLNLVTASFNSITNASTASFVNTLNQTLTLSGSLRVTGSQNFVGTVFVSGSKTIVGTNIITGALNITGSMLLTGPFTQNAATLLSPLVSGSMEYDGTAFYRTVDSNGRTLNANHHLFYLPSNIIHTTTSVVDAFSGSLNAITLQPNSLYEFQYNLFYQRGTGAGTTLWTLDFGAQTVSNGHIQLERSAIAGTGTTLNGSGTVTGAPLIKTVVGYNGNSLLLTEAGSDSASVYQKSIIKGIFTTGTSTPLGVLKLRVTAAAASGAITLLAGSYYTIKRMPATSVGEFILTGVVG